jgi:glycine C-acetyltransferase/8-amino-7-oxononanoate synthase
VREAAADAALRWGAGAGASRLVSGNMTLHRRLEERLAAFKGTQSALLFGSGYLANVAVIPALARRGEIVFSDELNHASIIDGCRLSGAETFVYRHGDVDHLAWGLRSADGRAALIVTDGVFSMDGDVAPLEEIVALASHHDVRVMVDDAHGTGTQGPGGRGVGRRGGARGRDRRARRDARQGARLVRRVRRVRCRAGALPRQQRARADLLHRPAAGRGGGCDGGAGAGHEQPRRVERLPSTPHAARRAGARGLRRLRLETQIVPLIVGDAGQALRICEAALERGVFAQAIRPPTVPEGTSRLRLAVMASHTRSELCDAARVIAQAALHEGLRPPPPVRSPPRAVWTLCGRRTPRDRRASSTATRRSACPGRRKHAGGR